MVDITSDVLEVQNQARDQKTDQKLEPEEQPARRMLGTETPVSGSIDGEVKGALPSAIAIHGTAIEFAKNAASQCRLCVHWDHMAWTKLLLHLRHHGSPTDWKDLNKMRALLVETGNATIANMHEDYQGDFDVEHALDALGICHAYTEIYREPVYTHPLGGCSEDRAPSGEDLSQCFRPRNANERVESTAIYDQIMQAATGKKSS